MRIPFYYDVLIVANLSYSFCSDRIVGSSGATYGKAKMTPKGRVPVVEVPRISKLFVSCLEILFFVGPDLLLCNCCSQYCSV